MPQIKYRVAEEIFAQYPTYVRGVVVARSVENGPSPSTLTALLREAEATVRARLTLEQLADNPAIACWREAFRRFGAKPSEFRSSIEAMARRVLHGQPLPSINMLVDIGNIVSLRHLVPVGGHAIDEVTHDLTLRPATGQERFVAFGASESIEHPTPGEIVFVEGDVVLTRRWTWRQAQHTLTLPETRAIEFNIDVLVPDLTGNIEAIGGELGELIVRYCGGQTHFEVLAREHPRMRFSVGRPPSDT